MKIYCILLLSVLSVVGFSQNTWTLKQCIDYALKHNLQIKQASIVSESNNLQWKQARYNRSPSANASISDGFNFGRTLGRDNTYVNQNSNSANGSVNLDVPIFQGFRITNDIAARKYDFMAAIEDYQKIKNDMSLTVMSYFLNVLVQKEFLKIAQNQLALIDTLVHRTEILVENGKELISKLYELKAQSSNDAFNVTNVEKNLKLALLDLAQLLDLENLENFDISIPNFNFDVSQMPIPIVVFENAVVTLPDVKAEEFRLESSKRSLEIAKSDYFPTVSFGASTSTNYFYMYRKDFPNDKFGSQIEQNWKSFVGMSVNIPIFNRFAIRTNISQSKMQIQYQELQVKQARNEVYKEIQRAILNAKVSKDRYIAATNAVQTNQKSFQLIERAFESGRITFFDMQQSRNNLERAQSEQIQAKYEFIFNTKILGFYSGKDLEL